MVVGSGGKIWVLLMSVVLLQLLELLLVLGGSRGCHSRNKCCCSSVNCSQIQVTIIIRSSSSIRCCGSTVIEVVLILMEFVALLSVGVEKKITSELNEWE